MVNGIMGLGFRIWDWGLGGISDLSRVNGLVADGRYLKSPSTQRMKIRRMPSSMREKAQSTWEPKAMGVKMRRRMRRISIMTSNFDLRISDFGKKLI